MHPPSPSDTARRRNARYLFRVLALAFLARSRWTPLSSSSVSLHPSLSLLPTTPVAMSQPPALGIHQRPAFQREDTSESKEKSLSTGASYPPTVPVIVEETGNLPANAVGSGAIDDHEPLTTKEKYLGTSGNVLPRTLLPRHLTFIAIGGTIVRFSIDERGCAGGACWRGG